MHGGPTERVMLVRTFQQNKNIQSLAAERAEIRPFGERQVYHVRRCIMCAGASCAQVHHVRTERAEGRAVGKIRTVRRGSLKLVQPGATVGSL